MNNKLRLTGYAGLIGSLLMYAGDMLLYFTTRTTAGLEKGFLPPMAGLSLGRLIAGGLMGTFAAVLCIIGFYHLFLRIKDPRRKTGRSMFAVLSISLVIVGAYHAFFPAFGTAAAQRHPEIIYLLPYAYWLVSFTFSLMGVGWMILIIWALQKQTVFPRWIVMATPLFAIWLIFFWRILPKPLEIIIAGGCYSLMYTVVFGTSLLTLKERKEERKNAKL